MLIFKLGVQYPLKSLPMDDKLMIVTLIFRDFQVNLHKSMEWNHSLIKMSLVHIENIILRAIKGQICASNSFFFLMQIYKKTKTKTLLSFFSFFLSLRFDRFMHFQSCNSLISWKQTNGQYTSINAMLTAHNWQNWKRVFLTCPCHEIYKDEAVGLKSCKYTWKITIYVNMWNLGQFREILIFCQ